MKYQCLTPYCSVNIISSDQLRIFLKALRLNQINSVLAIQFAFLRTSEVGLQIFGNTIQMLWVLLKEVLT